MKINFGKERLQENNSNWTAWWEHQLDRPMVIIEDFAATKRIKELVEKYPGCGCPAHFSLSTSADEVMDFFEEFSVTHHPVSLELLSGAFGRLASRATSMEELEQHLPALWSPGRGISVLEVDSSGCDNSLIYKDLFNKVK